MSILSRALNRVGIPIVILHSHAEISIGTYKAHKDEAPLRTYVTGLGKGMEWANILAQQTGKAIFCLPSDVTLNEAPYTSLINKGIAPGATDDQPIEMTIILGLAAAFPCSQP